MIRIAFLRSPTGQLPRRLPACAGAALLLLLLLPSVAACDSPSSAASATQLYVYPGNPLFAAATTLKARGQQAEGADLWAIADTPSGIWAAGQSGEMRQIKQVSLSAGRQHTVPVIVAYNLPDRDACGRLSSGSQVSGAGYRTWINQLANAIGPATDIVVVEPDGLPDLIRGCLGRTAATQRYNLLRYAMRRLGSLPHTRVYLDAGNPGMFGNPDRLTSALEKAGIWYGRGFSANVSNFQWTGVVVSWSERLESALGHGMKAVIDTSRNGNGPYDGPDSPQWCNPPGRALGAEPRLNPGPKGIDAYLWIKDPGASDGPCNGGPAAGQYWPQYAVGLYQSHRGGGV